MLVTTETLVVEGLARMIPSLLLLVLGAGSVWAFALVFALGPLFAAASGLLVLTSTGLAGQISGLSLSGLPARAEVQWKKYAGTKLEVILAKGPRGDNLQKYIKEFTELSGIKVESEQIPEQQQRQKGGADHASSRLRPVISSGCGSPISASTVGARSAKRPPARNLASAGPPTRITGTGLVVWAVCGPPVAGSIMVSQLP